MQILTLLSLSFLESTILSEKMSRAFHEKAKMRMLAEGFLSEIENNFFQKSLPCEIPLTDREEIVNKPLSWWQSVACMTILDSFQYYYVYEKMNETPYFRLTLFLINKKDNTREMLQSTLTKIDNAYLRQLFRTL